MFISDVNKKDEIRAIAIQELRLKGLKYRPKKLKNVPENKNRKVFKVHLQALQTQVVTLKDGQQLQVPIVLNQLCTFILSKADTEGIFRKEGSKSRQNEIKLSLDAGCFDVREHNVIDIAAVLKTILRDLPEPLIPYSYHDFFLRCSILESEKLESMLMLCLLLPTEHLNTLAYLLRFFNDVALQAKYNKMTAYNLAVCIAPNIFPFEEKVPNAQARITKTCEIVQILIENAQSIGMIPSKVIDQVDKHHSSEEDLTKRKKRRSGSLTRMFNGLKKIVTNKGDEQTISSSNIVTPDLLMTPSISRSSKKRRVESSGLSIRKKKDLISRLPESTLLNTPFTPTRTPICANPNPKTEKKTFTTSTDLYKNKELKEEKKTQWYSRSKLTKKPDDSNVTTRRSTLVPKGIERRWSVVSQAANFRKNKKRNSFAGTLTHPIKETKAPLEEYVRLPKNEYEEIKNRVSAIERRISLEMDIAVQKSPPKSNIQDVQQAYEQTLAQEQMSPSTDQLAKRLSRELKIRRSNETKIIRSPSARKIGTMRRRSKERLTRNQSWHVTSDQKPAPIIPRATLKRAQPVAIPRKEVPLLPVFATPNAPTNERVLRSSSAKKRQQILCNASGHSAESSWVSAEGFFAGVRTPNESCESANGRASIAKIRSQNAGMVMAKARLFDTLLESDKSTSFTKEITPKLPPKPKQIVSKTGFVRQNDVRLSTRVRALKNDDRRMPKKSMSPRRRNANVNMTKQRPHIVRNVVDNKENKNLHLTPSRMRLSPQKRTPKKHPHIKQSLTNKSPKRLCRTPNNSERCTPLKVLATPQCLKY